MIVLAASVIGAVLIFDKNILKIRYIKKVSNYLT